MYYEYVHQLSKDNICNELGQYQGPF